MIGVAADRKASNGTSVLVGAMRLMKSCLRRLTWEPP